jgi:23S rRNA (guanosine2251-2'-O)-methyltransferase
MKKQFFVVIDNVRSLENVGSVFRTADAFAVDKIYICGISPTPASRVGEPENEKLAKTALGAEKTVAWEYHKQTGRLLKKLKEQGVFVAALEQAPQSISLEKFRPTFPLALVLGHEVKGVSPSALRLADAIVEIPIHGQKESLNVAVAFGIAGYEINNRRFL